MDWSLYLRPSDPPRRLMDPVELDVDTFLVFSQVWNASLEVFNLTGQRPSEDLFSQRNAWLVRYRDLLTSQKRSVPLPSPLGLTHGEFVNYLVTLAAERETLVNLLCLQKAIKEWYSHPRKLEDLPANFLRGLELYINLQKSFVSQLDVSVKLHVASAGYTKQELESVYTEPEKLRVTTHEYLTEIYRFTTKTKGERVALQSWYSWVRTIERIELLQITSTLEGRVRITLKDGTAHELKVHRQAIRLTDPSAPTVERGVVSLVPVIE